MATDTPMIKQYLKIKKQYPDAILFFRLGDFYEMFFEDANIASKILGITLTSRNKSEKNPVPLCGVPYHSIEPYVSKLLQHGYKVAICEQIEDPKLAKGVVERKVIKVLTPGVILDSEKLDSKSNNFLAAIYFNGKSYGIACADISTGEFKTTSFPTFDDLSGELSNLEPKEVLLPEELSQDEEIRSSLIRKWNPLITTLDPWIWDLERAGEILKEFLSIRTLEAFGLEDHPESTVACGAIVHYIRETQMDDMPPLGDLSYYQTGEYVLIDESTKRNLELIRTLRSESKVGSLLWILDETLTAMGGRLLKQWTNYPLLDRAKIRERLDAVEELKDKPNLRKKIRDTLREVSDIERLVGRISTASARPRDLGALRDSSYLVSDIKEILGNLKSSIVIGIQHNLDELPDIRGLLERSIVSEPPVSTSDGGIIKEGFSSELDGLRSVRRSGKRWIAELELREKKSTGINSLKVGYNRVFGYYIEVTKSNLRLVPETYIRKQTLVNGERFITPELKEYEEKILGAEDRILELERELFGEIRKKVALESERIRRTASLVAELDVISSLSEVADKYNYAKPEIVDSGVIELKESRHPVIERMDMEERFVPNDLKLDSEENQFLIITGPNMAGKSTLIRQAALIVLMAQMGSFIPAKLGKIGIVDKIFTRVGASDNIAAGLSTFMVEMVETAYILRHATPESLVILDEIGRGTSTFDGMSIAWAVAEFLHDVGCRTLFATHYHELAQLAISKRRVKNYNVFVKEDKDSIVFLRKLVPGAASHSYGIQVARLAGVPEKVLKTARSVLSKLEKAQSNLGGTIVGRQVGLFDKQDIEEKENGKDSEILEEIKRLDPLSLTPLDALSKLIEIKEKIDKK
ncbi:MAG TPA: DNA mismatch repair protein MutS [Thermodesulfobacteriota bacterium]|nr:DNA mismatch repair protein MutS [Thermodesulfobacteriota bacterium]